MNWRLRLKWIIPGLGFFLICDLGLLELQAQSADIVAAVPIVSALPDNFQSGHKTTAEIQANWRVVARKLGPSGLGSEVFKRFTETAQTAVGGGLNMGPQFRRDALYSALKDKFTKHFHDVYEVSRIIGVEPKAVILAMLTENTLATNNSATKFGIPVTDLKTLDHSLTQGIEALENAAAPVGSVSHKSLENYADRIAQCDGGQINSRPNHAEKDILSLLGRPQDDCTVCKKDFENDAMYRFACYWAFLGEVKVPGGTLSDGGKKASGYGPAQLHLENALSIVDVPGFYGGSGSVTGYSKPTDTEKLLENLDDLIFEWRGSVGIVAAMLKAAETKFLEKNWDISQDYPVLVTMYHIGNVAFHTAEAQPPGGKYYPTSDFFGTYSVLLESTVDAVVQMGTDIELGKATEWDLHKIRALADQIP